MKLELELAIRRPREDVFAYLADASHLPEWQESAVAAEAEGEPGVGMRIRETRSFMGRQARVDSEIVEFERPRLLTVRSSAGPVRFTVRHELEPADEGTLLRVEAEVDLPGGLGRLAAPLATRTAAKQFRADFERLKQLLES